MLGMADRKHHEADQFEEEQALWDAYVRIRREQGIDVNGILAEFVKCEKRQLNSTGGLLHFAELCKKGCVPPILAGIVALIRFSPNAQELWSKVVGGLYKRGKAVRAFETAARTVDDLFKAFATTGNDVRQTARLQALGRIPPSAVASELRFYARFVTLAERISKDAEVRSVGALAKYALAGYVRRATGQFHDRATSGLIAELQGRRTYNEIAHRMWRARNYARYDKNFGYFIDLMVAFGVVIARST